VPIPTDSFSKRFAARPKGPAPKPDEMPESVRVKIIPVIDGLRGNNLSGACSLGPALYEAIGRIAPAPTGEMPMIGKLFREAEWWEIHDLCEALVRQSRYAEATVTAIEDLFRNGKPTVRHDRGRYRVALLCACLRGCC